MEPFDDMCRCGVICTCGGDDWGEDPDREIVQPGDQDHDWPERGAMKTGF